LGIPRPGGRLAGGATDAGCPTPGFVRSGSVRVGTRFGADSVPVPRCEPGGNDP